MKRSILMYLFIGVTFIFFGCTEDDILVPSEFNKSNDGTISLEKGDYNYDDKLFKDGDPYSGVCSPYGDPSDHDPEFIRDLPDYKFLTKGAQTTWYDDASDDRIKGISTWYVDTTVKKNGVEKFWGKAEILVDNEFYQGKWKMTWHGYITPVYESGVPIGVDLDCIAFGRGVDGDVKGLVAKCHYLMEFRFDDFPASLVYNFTGTIK